jgi:anti-sigma B factor antagonist
MFGKHRHQPEPRRLAGAAPPRKTPGDFGFQADSVIGSRRSDTLANYDRLGQTLVATPTASTLSGPDAAELASDLCARIHEAYHSPEGDRSGIRHVVMDLQNVQYMDSMCVGVLVELLTTLKEAGGRIALVNASSNVEYLFKLTRLDRVFPICRDVMKAIEAVERAG